MQLFPYMVKEEVKAGKTEVFAFGESYGGSYVVSLGRAYLRARAGDRSFGPEPNFLLSGVAIGNGFISPPDQSIYAESFRNIAYLTKEEQVLFCI